MKFNLELDTDIFDTHVNVGRVGIKKEGIHDVQFFKGRELAMSNDIKDYVKKNGIKKILVSPHEHSDLDIPFTEYNHIVINICDQLKNAYGAVWVNPSLQSPTIDAMNMIARNLKIRALKMHPDTWSGNITADPETWNDNFKTTMEKVLDFAKDERLVLQLPTGMGKCSVENYDKFIHEYGSRLRIHFLHMGGYKEGYAKFAHKFAGWIKEGYKFYADFSSTHGMTLPYVVQEFRETCPAAVDRILFASDEPYGSFAATHALIKSSGLDRDTKFKILYDNADHLYCSDKQV